MTIAYTFKAIIDGIDVNLVISNLQIQTKPFETKDYDIRGVEFLIKTFCLFDPRKNKDITIKTQIWVTSNEERFSFVVPMYYRGSLVAFFIKENNVRTVEEFQTIVKNTSISIIKILDTPREFTLELFESTMKELIELYE